MKNAWKWLLWAAVVMIGLPFLAVKLVPGDAGMAVCFLLFFAVDPVFSAVSGWENPGNWRNQWNKNKASAWSWNQRMLCVV